MSMDVVCARSLFAENWLFSREGDLQELEARGRLLGMEIGAPHAVALLGLAGETPFRDGEAEPEALALRLVHSGLFRSGEHCCAIGRKRLLLLLEEAGTSPLLRVQGIARRLGEGRAAPVWAGISTFSRGAADIRRCYEEARSALAAAEHSAGGQVVLYDAASLDFALCSVPRGVRRDLQQRLLAGLEPEKQGEYRRLIRAFFRENGDADACARALYIHQNTFRNRLKALKKDTGLDLRSMKDAFLLYLAFWEE